MGLRNLGLSKISGRGFGAAVILAAVCAGTANAQTWRGEWNAVSGSFPDAHGWTYNPFYEPQIPPTLTAGVLHQGLSTIGGVDYWTRIDVPTDWATDGGLAFEIRLKVDSATEFILGTPCAGSSIPTWGAGFQIELSDQNRRTVVLGISETGIRMASDYCRDPANSTSFIPMNTTASFNTYRLTMSLRGIDLSVNGQIVGHLLLGSTPQYSNEANRWAFGDTSVGVRCQTQIQYVKWGQVCRADFDESGTVTIGDIFAFLNAWFASDPRTDFNGFGGVGISDIFDFLNAWFAGCP